MSKYVNAKAVAGNARKAENASKKKAVVDKASAEREDADWAKGAKDGSRGEDAASKAKAKADRKAELAALEAEDSEGLTAKVKKKKKKKGAGDDDFASAMAAMTGKKAPKKKAVRQGGGIAPKASGSTSAHTGTGPSLKSTGGSAVVEDESVFEFVNTNRAGGTATATSIEAAIDALEVGGGAGLAGGGAGAVLAADGGNVNMKAAYLEYEEAQMPVFRSDYPGLKRSQYKEKIFKQWQKAPENPMVQRAAAMAASGGAFT
jgi:hypothetical protein